jgi:hypothetical protein
MNIDNLRDLIWEHLFRAKSTKSIDEIATLTNCDITAVGAAVNHEWFVVTDHGVSIAYAARAVNDRR